MNEQTLPALRYVDVVPVEGDDGDPRFVLRDPSQIAPHAMAVSAAGYFVCAHLDGGHSCADIQRAFLHQFGAMIAPEDVQELVEALDDALLLHTERYEKAYESARKAFADSDVRDNRDRWPDEATLRKELDRCLAAGASVEVDRLRGVVAPHLDYERGFPCYADAYAALRAAGPAERYVILGTNHFGRSRSVVATGKDFLTPLGRVRNDVEWLERIESALGRNLREHEFDHAREHSIELQVHLLQALWPRHGFEIAAFLCPDPCGPTGTRPADGEGPDLEDFINALRVALDESAKTTVLIASADLSHVGMHFGDSEPTTDAFLEDVGRNDRRLLELLTQRREREFVDDVARAGNHTRICSVGCVYTLFRALPDARSRVLRYHQAENRETETTVSCAAMLLDSE
ncbi:MAG: AmmeMemoRadiSam system protein B [Planctomycetota bacterium]|nr:MAG: AmmeMemoRadiSam system protein B [Planctomycetota bacterium]